MCRSKHLELIRKDLKEEEIGFLGNCFQNPNIRGILLFEIKENLTLKQGIFVLTCENRDF